MSHTATAQFQLLGHASNGNVEHVRELLAADNASVVAGSPGGFTALGAACMAGQLGVVEAVLQQPEGRQEVLWPCLPRALSAAAAMGHDSIVQLLVNHLPCIKDMDLQPWEPLHAAAAAGHAKTVQLLLDHTSCSCSVNAMSSMGRTPLHMATRSGCVQTIKSLLVAGADLNVQAALTGATALHMAAASETGEQMVLQLLAAGADPGALNTRGWTPFHMAAAYDRPAAAKAVMLHNHQQQQPICAAPGPAEDEMACNLCGSCSVECSCSSPVIFAKANDGRTPLHVAAACQSLRVLPLLLPALAAVDNMGHTPLHLAAALSDTPELVRRLVGAGAAVMARDAAQRTPLHFAAQQGQVCVAELLLSMGADGHAVDAQQRTPLRVAVLGNQPEMVSMLLARGSASHINSGCNKGFTPLHVAARNMRCDIAKLLLCHGANVNATSGAGSTPLDCAAQVKGCRADMVELLLSKGARVLPRTLVRAAANCEGSAVQQLLFALGEEAHTEVVTAALSAAANASHWDAFAVLAKALNALDPQRLTQLLMRMDKTSVVAAAIACCNAWQGGVRDVEQQMQRVGMERQSVAAEKLAVQQLIVGMAAGDRAKRRMGAAAIDDDEEEGNNEKKKARM